MRVKVLSWVCGISPTKSSKHRLASVDEIAAAALFLCSAAARYINGAALVVDGAGYLGHWTDMHDPDRPL